MMRIAEALDAFSPHRGDAIVVPGRGGRYWVEQTGNPALDDHNRRAADVEVPRWVAAEQVEVARCRR